MKKYDYKKLPPFKGMVLQNFPFIEEDFDAITNYQLLCKVVEYLNVIAKNNDEMIDNINTLNTWFENLDVQEEINNKLDEMVEDGTLENIVSDYLVNGKGRVFYIFPSMTSYTSEYNIIKTNNTNLLIDCGHYNEYLNLKNTLAKYQISKIKNIVITHFHGDHVGNFTSLVNDGYIDENTNIYLPNYNSTTWQNNSSYTHYLDVMNTIESNNLTYSTPTENEIITLDTNLSCEFFNTNDTYYIDNNLSDDYNEASLVLLIKHFNINSLYTGDCKDVALNRIYNTNRIPDTLHIYKMGHHGIDTSSHSNNLIIKNCNIINSIEIIGIEDVSLGKANSTGGSFTLSQITNIYMTCYNKNNIIFNSFNDLINLVNGIEGGSDNYNSMIKTIYVEPNSNLIQNGTETYPYANLNQAIGHSLKNKGFDYEIHVASGTYSSWLPTSYDTICAIDNVINTIHIIGDSTNMPVIEYCIEIYNASNVIIENICIDNKTKNRGFDITASNVLLKNVKYTKSDASLSNQRAISIQNNSHVIIDGAVIEYASFGLREEYSTIDVKNISFKNISSVCLDFIGGIINNISSITLLDTSSFYREETIKPNYIGGFELLSTDFKYTDNETHVIPLLISAKKFKKIKIQYGIAGYITSVIYDVKNSDNHISLNDNHVTATGDLYLYESRIDLSNSDSCNYAYSRLISRSYSDGTYTYSDNIDTYTIYSIKGY